MTRVLPLINSYIATCNPANIFFCLCRILRDKRGVAAVEFGYIAPLMIVMYMGVVELSTALTADRRVTNVASSIADLVSQNESVTTDDLNAIFNIAESLLNPLNQNAFDTSSLQIKVTSIVQEDDITKVVWSHAYGGATPDTPDEEKTLPNDNMTQDLSSIIEAEITYSYDSFLDYFIEGVVEMKDTYYVRPRKSLQVVCSDCPTS